MSRKRNAFWIPMGLLLCFLLPLWLAYYFYHHAREFHFKQSNHGDLIRPPIAFKELVFKSEASDGVWTAPAGKWVIVFYAECFNQHTLKSIYYMRQVQAALGKDSDRVVNLLVLSKKCKLSRAKKILTQAYPQFQLVLSDEKNQKIFREELKERGLSIESNGALYLVDPAGNVMMHFPSRVSPKDWYQDIKYLLRVSQIG